ncbi:MAG: lysophospholipid acyltransferase family protein [Planctomycetota bacterium]
MKPPAAHGEATTGSGERWLRLFFWLSRRAGWFVRGLRPAAVQGVWLCHRPTREAVRANLRHVLAPDADGRTIDRVGRAVVGDFYDFVIDIAAAQPLSADDLDRRVAAIHGTEAYESARANFRGAVLVTAHFGSFEVGLAAVRRIEPRVHVVFRRDALGGFERMRRSLHETLGVVETPIDDGPTSWLALRDALGDNAVVVLQGDRVMPGQRGLAVPMFGATLELPVGPAKLALMTGAPLVPVFAVRDASGGGGHSGGGRVTIELGEPIAVPDAAAVEPATRAVGAAIEAVVRRHPEQWHVLHRVLD